MLMVVVMIVFVIMAMLVLLRRYCFQLRVGSLIRHYLVCFCRLSRVQINAFQRRP